MKMKKKSTAVIICAAMLVAGISTVFATSPIPESKNMEDLPSAVMTNATTLPIPASVEQDVPQNTPSVPDTSTEPQTDPAAPEQDTDPVQQTIDTSVEPAADTTEPQQAVQSESAASALVDRWGVPADPIPKNTRIRAGTKEDQEELCQYLTQVRGIQDGDMVECVFPISGEYGIAITYGAVADHEVVGEDDPGL